VKELHLSSSSELDLSITWEGDPEPGAIFGPLKPSMSMFSSDWELSEMVLRPFQTN